MSEELGNRKPSMHPTCMHQDMGGRLFGLVISPHGTGAQLGDHAESMGGTLSQASCKMLSRVVKRDINSASGLLQSSPGLLVVGMLRQEGLPKGQ